MTNFIELVYIFTVIGVADVYVSSPSQTKVRKERSGLSTLGLRRLRTLQDDHLRFMPDYSKTCLKRPLKNTKIGFQYRLSLNASQKYCRMLQGEHSAIVSNCIKLPSVFKTFLLNIFE